MFLFSALFLENSLPVPTAQARMESIRMNPTFPLCSSGSTHPLPNSEVLWMDNQNVLLKKVEPFFILACLARRIV